LNTLTPEFDQQTADDRPPRLRPLHYGDIRPADEHANLATHGAGLALSLLGSALLLSAAWRQPDLGLAVACAVYCITLLGVYGEDVAWRRPFRTLDQACIFLLIAGTYTPFGVKYLNGGGWAWLLAAMWLLACAGAAGACWNGGVYAHAKIVYGLLGWLPGIALPALMQATTREVMALVIAGGLCYSIGAIFLIFDRHVRYFHAVWHTFVIAGSVCHFLAIWEMLELR
jgi:hemolysin III